MDFEQLEKKLEALKQLAYQDGITLFDNSVFGLGNLYSFLGPSFRTLDTAAFKYTSAIADNMSLLFEDEKSGASVIPEVPIEFDAARTSIKKIRRAVETYNYTGSFRYIQQKSPTYLSKKRVLRIRYKKYDNRHVRRRGRTQKEYSDHLAVLDDTLRSLERLSRAMKRRQYLIAVNDPVYEQLVGFLVYFDDVEKILGDRDARFSYLHTDEKMVAATYYISLLEGKPIRIVTRDSRLANLLERSFTLLIDLDQTDGLSDAQISAYSSFDQPSLEFDSTEMPFDYYLFRTNNPARIRGIIKQGVELLKTIAYSKSLAD